MTTSNKHKNIIEILVDSVESSLAAQEGGADRVELCANVFEGGTTHSFGTIALVKEQLDIDINIIIRPRGGDFCYSDLEFKTMCRNIQMAKDIGVDGVVFGVLSPDGNIDIERTRKLIQIANPLSVTFHRAFDMVSDPYQALEDLIILGADRILTSGQNKSAIEGIDLICELVKRADDRIIIMPGGGIKPNNILEIKERSGAHEFHMSAFKQRESKMTYRNSKVLMGKKLYPSEYSIRMTDKKLVSQLVQAVTLE